uniref:Uncharacterized protein n=1 Tax=viral metagenome TaxID=1070528 RepID=A0A6C0KK71_9ZZZZ
MKKTQLKRRAKRHNKKTRRLHGKSGGEEPVVAHEMTKILEADAYEEAKSYQNIINHFMETQTDSFQYLMLQDRFSTYETNIKSKQPDELTYGDLAEMKNLVFAIIKDDVDQRGLYFDKNSANFQNLLNNILMYFVNDIPVEDTIILNYRKRIVNNKPYIEVTHTKTGEETVFDVNEIFAMLKNEMRTTKKTEPKSTILKTTTIKNNRKVETVPKKTAEESEKKDSA